MPRKYTQRKKTVDPFYKSAAWFKIRGRVLKRDGYRCVNCGGSVRAKGAGRVDHILPRRKFPEQALHMPNLRTLCVKCDNARHAWDRAAHGARGEAKEIGPDGFPIGSDWSS